MKCLPSGRNCGQLWLTSLRSLSSVVAGVTGPPSAETRISGPPDSDGSNTIVSDWFHVPPWIRPGPVSQMLWADPPETAIFLSCWFAKNPMNLPSGDQNGKFAPTELSRRWADNESNG